MESKNLCIQVFSVTFSKCLLRLIVTANSNVIKYLRNDDSLYRALYLDCTRIMSSGKFYSLPSS